MLRHGREDLAHRRSRVSDNRADRGCGGGRVGIALPWRITNCLGIDCRHEGPCRDGLRRAVTRGSTRHGGLARSSPTRSPIAVSGMTSFDSTGRGRLIGAIRGGGQRGN